MKGFSAFPRRAEGCDYGSMKLLPFILLIVAGVLVCYGYSALTGPIAPNVRVWWTGMVGPFVVAAVALLLIRILSAKGHNWVTTAGSIYAIGVSVMGMLIAGVLFGGRSNVGQNHSDYGLLFVGLWGITLPIALILVGLAIWQRVRKSR